MCIRFLPASVTRKRKFNARRPKRPGFGQSTVPHFHAWTQAGFEALLHAASDLVPFRLIDTASVVNENLFVLRKISAIEFRTRRTWRRITAGLHSISSDNLPSQRCTG